MPLSSEFEEFYRRWLEKADDYHGQTLNDYFDKFFTLFVLFNRLYAEVTFILYRRDQSNLSKGKKQPFPDAKAAKTYVLQYIGSRNLLSCLDGDADASDALSTIKNLIRDERFYIKLDMMTGNPQPDKDKQLLQDLESRCLEKRGKAILDILYSIRCNMFHGHKGFDKVQVDILRPTVCLLRKIVEVLHVKLTEEPMRANKGFQSDRCQDSAR